MNTFLQKSYKLGSQEEESKKQGSGMPLLPNDEEYIGYIGGIRLLKQSDYNDPTKEVERLAVDMLVVSAKDGTEVEDAEGNAIEPLSLMLTKYGINPSATGFKTDGTPSYFRSFIAYATGQNVSDPLEIDSLQDLVGKFIAFSVLTKKNEKTGNKKTRVQNFRPLPRKFNPSEEEFAQCKEAFDAIITKITERKKEKDTSKSNNEFVAPNF